jgi:hypothetical protein
MTFDLHATPPWRLTLNRCGAEEELPTLPTILMQRVSQWLDGRPDPASLNAIEKAVLGKGRGIRWAVKELVKAGYVETVPGRQRGVVAYVLRRSFVHSDGIDFGPDIGPPTSGDLGLLRPGVRSDANPVTKGDAGDFGPLRPALGPTGRPDSGPPPSPLKEGGAGPKPTGRCGWCGKRGSSTEPGEPVCRCQEGSFEDWRDLLPEGAPDEASG